MVIKAAVIGPLGLHMLSSFSNGTAAGGYLSLEKFQLPAAGGPRKQVQPIVLGALLPAHAIAAPLPVEEHLPIGKGFLQSAQALAPGPLILQTAGLAPLVSRLSALPAGWSSSRWTAPLRGRDGVWIALRRIRQQSRPRRRQTRKHCCCCRCRRCPHCRSNSCGRNRRTEATTRRPCR